MEKFFLVEFSTSIFRSRLLTDNSMWMEETNLRTMNIGHPEQRNLYNKIFGGYLMRKSFELAWTTASLFAYVFHFLLCLSISMFIQETIVEYIRSG